MLRLLPRDSETPTCCVASGGLLALEAAAGTSHHGARRRREASRRVCALLWARSDHNQRGTARARSKLACCASSRETASAGARAARGTRRWLGVGGRSWHVAPRPRAEGERPLAGAAPFYERTDRPQPARHGARAQQARVLRLLPRDSERRRASRVPREPAGLCEAAAGTSHHGRAPKERGLSPTQCLSKCMSRPQPARHGARAGKLECCASSPETASAGAPALGTRRWLGVGGRSWHVAPRPRAEGERPLAGAVLFS